jgi:hypothetical protein
MAIAVDQSRLRRIVQALLPDASLRRGEAMTILQFVRLAAGIDDDDNPDEHAIMQVIAQQVGCLSGLAAGDLLPSAPMDDEHTRAHWLSALAVHLPRPGVRDFTYALVFLVSVADLQLTVSERDSLEEFQYALGLDDRRATDIVVLLTEIVAASEPGAYARA